MVIEDQKISFSELEALSNSVANGRVSVGVQPGDRVALYGPNCWEWIVAYYAAVKTGAVVNPISSMLTVEEVRYVVKDSGGRVLLTSAEMGVPLFELVGTENLSHVVLWGDEVPVGATSSMEWANEADRHLRAGSPWACRPGGDLLHVRDDRASEGCDAEQPLGPGRRGRHRSDGSPVVRAIGSLT